MRLYSAGGDEIAWLEGLKFFPNVKRVEVAVEVLRFCKWTADAWTAGIEARVKKATNAQVQVVYYYRSGEIRHGY